jgi:RimJ/RimL family protein N-acetyltransferase
MIFITPRTRRPSTTIESTRSLLEKWIASLEQPWVDNYAILLRSPIPTLNGKARMIGTVGAVRIPENQGDAVEIAYGVLSDFWGEGYASEALRMFVELYWDPKRKLVIDL